jgi:CubicO group peptidase (beta-lactamase class C family)
VWPEYVHEWTYGWLIGEVVRRATRRPISWVLAEEIARPLHADRELFFGVPAERAPEGRPPEGPELAAGAGGAQRTVSQLDGTRFGWSGNGGGLAGFYPDLGLSVAVTKNYLGTSEDDPMQSVAALIHATVTG